MASPISDNGSPRPWHEDRFDTRNDDVSIYMEGVGNDTSIPMRNYNNRDYILSSPTPSILSSAAAGRGFSPRLHSARSSIASAIDVGGNAQNGGGSGYNTPRIGGGAFAAESSSPAPKTALNGQPLSRNGSISLPSSTGLYPDPPPSAGPAIALNKNSSSPPSSNSFWDSAPYWLALYFFFNLSLTLYNKIALISFPFPWTLTCIHSLSATIGSLAAYRRGYFVRTQNLKTNEHFVLIAFSSLYTINIAVSNLSLNLVSVSLHQVVRSTTPLFTIIISVAMFRKSYLLQTYISLIPVILGVGLATYGDYSFTPWGLFLTFLGAFLAAVKGIATNRILVGRLRFHPLDLLLRMSPLAFVQCLFFSYASGELEQVYQRTFVTKSLSSNAWTLLFLNGLIAFGLNVVSFTANKKTGALTMSVAANVKQVLTIILAVVIFDLAINGTNLVGIGLTILGGAYYSYVEYKSKPSSAAPANRPANLNLSSTTTLAPQKIHYYEKRSPLLPPSPGKEYINPFLEAQMQYHQQPVDQQRQLTPPISHSNGNNPSSRAVTAGSPTNPHPLPLKPEYLSEKSASVPYHRKNNSLAGFMFPKRDIAIARG